MSSIFKQPAASAMALCILWITSCSPGGQPTALGSASLDAGAGAGPAITVKPSLMYIRKKPNQIAYVTTARGPVTFLVTGVINYSTPCASVKPKKTAGNVYQFVIGGEWNGHCLVKFFDKRYDVAILRVRNGP